MILTLTRNCTHGSEKYFYEVNNYKFNYLKCAASSYFVNELINEYKGWKWYSSKVSMNHNDLSYLQIINPSYAKLWIKKFHGKKISIFKGIKYNLSNFKLICDHYMSVWGPPKKNIYPFHGDLSLDNIIFTNEGVRVIDWEHFKHIGCPWGFDLFYLLFETEWFKNKRTLIRKNLDLFGIISIFKYLINTYNIPKLYFVSPLKKVVEFIKNNLNLWGKQLELYPMKLPVLSFSQDTIQNIDEKINFSIQASWKN